MASLWEYFKHDSRHNFSIERKWPIQSQSGQTFGEVVARLHLDFDANAKYVSFYVPIMSCVELAEALVLNEIPEMLRWPETDVGIQVLDPEKTHDGSELVFTGQVYLYSERPVPKTEKDRLTVEAVRAGHRLVFRSVEYAQERDKWEKPRAFISHDSRDKEAIAEPLALHLYKLMCPVWYDQYSLTIGDSLRESIERGLRECSKCIVVLTPNFLNNKGWTKREYDSIFTRELIEKRNVILPVWHNITVEEVFQYSPILADRFAVDWSRGIDEVGRKLSAAINGK